MTYLQNTVIITIWTFETIIRNKKHFETKVWVAEVKEDGTMKGADEYEVEENIVKFRLCFHSLTMLS